VEKVMRDINYFAPLEAIYDTDVFFLARRMPLEEIVKWCQAYYPDYDFIDTMGKDDLNLFI